MRVYQSLLAFILALLFITPEFVAAAPKGMGKGARRKILLTFLHWKNTLFNFIFKWLEFEVEAMVEVGVAMAAVHIHMDQLEPMGNQ